jgi:hypothetical protein
MDDDMEPLFSGDDLERWKRGELPPDWLKTQMAILKRGAELFRDDLDEQIAWAKANDPAMYARLMKPI